jgi:signal transduction histidine kinase
VVVIDQSRELSPSYRVLWISLIVGGVGLVLVIVVGSIISKAIVKPFEENDKGQKRFIADAARTLRTPVSVISIDAATLKAKLPDDESLNSIEKQAKKLLKLASDLNSFAGASKDNANKAKTNLSNVLKDVLKLYEDGFKAAGKKLETSIEEGLEANVDDGMIRKALSEIIENLLKYSTTKAMISLRKEGDRVVLETRNDFPGIAEGPLDRVFDRFYRLDADNMSKYEGNGVGLSIVKEIVDAHRGRAKAKGENGDFVLKIEF